MRPPSPSRTDAAALASLRRMSPNRYDARSNYRPITRGWTNIFAARTFGSRRLKNLKLIYCHNKATCPSVTAQEEARWQVRPWGAPDDDDAHAACHGLHALDRPVRPRRCARAGKRDRGRDRHRHAVPGRGRRRSTRRRATRPMPGAIIPTRVLWGDTHLHTANSLDAAAFGNTLGPEEAYRFARGEEVVSSSGQPVKLSRPLDFLVVADHAEGLGATVEMKKGNPLLMADPTLKRWHDMMAAGERRRRRRSRSSARSARARRRRRCSDPQLARSVWQDYTGHRRALQRARPLHRPDRLRVDLEQRRQQSAPRRDLPGRQGQGRPDRAVLRRSTARTRRSCGSSWIAYQDKTGGDGPGHPAQRQSLQRPHVRAWSISTAAA